MTEDIKNTLTIFMCIMLVSFAVDPLDAKKITMPIKYNCTPAVMTGLVDSKSIVVEYKRSDQPIAMSLIKNSDGTGYNANFEGNTQGRKAKLGISMGGKSDYSTYWTHLRDGENLPFKLCTGKGGKPTL